MGSGGAESLKVVRCFDGGRRPGSVGGCVVLYMMVCDREPVEMLQDRCCVTRGEGSADDGGGSADDGEGSADDGGGSADDGGGSGNDVGGRI